MSEPNNGSPSSDDPPRVQRPLLALALVASALCLPASAGQTGSSFKVSVTLLPATPSCTASLGADAVPQVNCGAVGGSTAPVLPAPPAQEFHLPDHRVMVAGARVEVADQSFAAWSEYSSRLVETRTGEYLEMTVTW